MEAGVARAGAVVVGHHLDEVRVGRHLLVVLLGFDHQPAFVAGIGERLQHEPQRRRLAAACLVVFGVAWVVFSWPAIGTLNPATTWGQRAVTVPLAIAGAVIASAGTGVLLPTLQHVRAYTNNGQAR